MVAVTTLRCDQRYRKSGLKQKFGGKEPIPVFFTFMEQLDLMVPSDGSANREDQSRNNQRDLCHALFSAVSELSGQTC